ncbi:MAG: SsrA-binding protein SmpB [bacterium]
MPVLAVNKKTHYDYDLLDTFEAGLVLTGNEVKAIKNNLLSLKGAYVSLRHNPKTNRPEAWLIGAHISPYQPANAPKDYKPEQPRKLLLNRQEINSLIGKLQVKGLTLLPLKVYTKQAKIKLAIGLGRGRRKVDKREAIKNRDQKREIGHLMKSSRQRG